MNGDGLNHPPCSDLSESMIVSPAMVTHLVGSGARFSCAAACPATAKTAPATSAGAASVRTIARRLSHVIASLLGGRELSNNSLRDLLQTGDLLIDLVGHGGEIRILDHRLTFLGNVAHPLVVDRKVLFPEIAGADDFQRHSVDRCLRPFACNGPEILGRRLPIDLSKVREGQMTAAFKFTRVPYGQPQPTVFTQAVAFTSPVSHGVAGDDRAAIARQGICPVTGGKLGSMGEPVKVGRGAVAVCMLLGVHRQSQSRPRLLSGQGG